MRVLGLDISTSCVGVAIVEDGEPVVVGAVKLSHIDDLFDRASAALNAVLTACATRGVVDAIFVEESLQAFRPGMSTANTICSLAKMNGLLSFLVKTALSVGVEYVSAQTARKLCRVKTSRGEPVKKQVFKQITASVLSGWTIPTKRNSAEYADAALDACDALVIALAGCEIISARSGGVASAHARHPDRLGSAVAAATTVWTRGSLEIWKGSLCEVSISVVPIS